MDYGTTFVYVCLIRTHVPNMAKATSKDLSTYHGRLVYFRSTFVKKNMYGLALELGMDRSQYSRTEKGAMYLNVPSILYLAEAYQLNIHWLYTGDGSPQFHPNQQKALNEVRTLVDKLKQVVG